MRQERQGGTAARSFCVGLILRSLVGVIFYLLTTSAFAGATVSNVLQPANGTVLRPGSNVALSGNAQGTYVVVKGEIRDYFITRVEIRRNGTLLGNATLSPQDGNDPPGYTWTYNDNVTTPGTYVYSSLAYDSNNDPQNSSSSTRSVTIQANSPPSVSVTAPGDGTVVNVIAGAISLTVNASDSDGSISSLSYFANGTNIGTGTGSNFALNYGLPAAGNYAITATAVDNEGGRTTSSPVSLYVRGPVTGNIDGIRTIAGGEPALVGWACDIATGLGIQVHFYRGGAYGTGQFVQAYNADQASEPGIGSSCGDSGVAHRLTIPVRNRYGHPSSSLRLA